MQDFLQRFLEIDGVWAGDDAALGAIEGIEQAGREKIADLGGSGMTVLRYWAGARGSGAC